MKATTTTRMRALGKPADYPIRAFCRGALESSDWLDWLNLDEPVQLWHVEIVLDVFDEPARQHWRSELDTRFHLYIYPREWGYLFCDAGKTSWIRVADRAYVHVRDEHDLLGETPRLLEIGTLVRQLEARHRVAFHREHALVTSSLACEPIRAWIASL